MPALEMVADGQRPLRQSTGHVVAGSIVAEKGGKAGIVFRVEDGCGQVVHCLQRLQRFFGSLGIVKGKRGDAVFSDDIGQRRKLIGYFLAFRDELIANESHTSQQ